MQRLRSATDFEILKPDSSLATVIVSLKIVYPYDEVKDRLGSPKSTLRRGRQSDRMIRLHFEAATKDGVTECPITIRTDCPIFNEQSSCFGYGYFTLVKGEQYISDREHSNCGRIWDNDMPIDLTELRELPLSVDHAVPDYFFSNAKDNLGLADGERTVLHLNTTSIGIHFWTPKSLEDIKDSKIFEHHAEGRAKQWENAGWKVDVGSDPSLLHWDITNACCPVEI